MLFAAEEAGRRLSYERVATDEGLRVELAPDGAEALALAERLLPDVVVLDSKLPGIESEEVARRLRASANTRTIPVVIVHAPTRSAEGIDGSGMAEAYLVKPCGTEALIRLVKTLARRGLGPREASRGRLQ